MAAVCRRYELLGIMRKIPARESPRRLWPTVIVIVVCTLSQGYTKPREYIVTEWPIKHTPGDFWSLVYDYECSAVVVLCLPPRESVSVPSVGRFSAEYSTSAFV